MCASIAWRIGCSSSRSGIAEPILALKSPQTSVINYGCILSSTLSTWVVACVSSMLRLVSDVEGGMYIFTILIRWLFGRIILVCRLYSFPCDVSSFSGLRIYVASPPRVLFGRRCSTRWKPSRIGAAAPSAIHVSWRHKMSRLSCSRRRSSFR
jgi:hypothetical protein